MAERDLDMGFTVDEVVESVRRLVARLGCDAPPVVLDGGALRFAGPEGTTIEVGPMPVERLTYPTFFPRARLVIRGDDPAVERLHREVIHAFLRPMG